MPFVSDTFSGTNGTALQSRSGEIGATWTKRTDTGSYDWAVNGGSAYYGGPATYGIRYAASGVPASAEYDVEAVFECLSVVNSYPGICGRFQAGVDTNYQVVYNGGTWSLYKVVAGANTLLGSYASSFTSGTRTVKLEIRNATKRVYFDGSSSPAISSTDNAITNAGAVGITDYLVASRTATTGYRLQSIVASDASAGTTYTEPLTAVLASVTSIDDRQTYQEAAAVLIQAGAAAEAVITMMEQVVALGQTETAATGLLTLAEQALATIQGAATLADAVTAAEALAATVISQTTVTDSQTSQGAEDLLVAVQSATSATDVVNAVEQLIATITATITATDTQTGAAQTYPETLLVTATVAAEAGAAQSMVEGLTVVAQGDVSVVDFRGYLEQIAATAQTIATVADRHLMIDNVTIMALSGASLGEIAAYLEQVLVTAQAQASLTDVLLAQFIGRYLYTVTVPPRSFASEVRPRSFTTTVRARC